MEQVPPTKDTGSTSKKKLDPKKIFSIATILGTFLTLGGTIYLYKNARDQLTHCNNMLTQLEQDTAPTTTINEPKVDPQLQKTEFGEGKVKITNLLWQFELVAPATYNLIGDTNNFSVSFDGPNSGSAPPQDLVNVNFQIHKLDENETFYEKVKAEYTLSKKARGETADYKDLTNITIGEVAGYTYPCWFLVRQDCAYLPLGSDNYLSILTTISDDYQRGYSQEIDQILSTLKFY